VVLLCGCTAAISSKGDNISSEEYVTVENIATDEYILSYQGLQRESLEKIKSILEAKARSLCHNSEYVREYSSESLTTQYSVVGSNSVCCSSVLYVTLNIQCISS
jgi:hypothetical protein